MQILQHQTFIDKIHKIIILKLSRAKKIQKNSMANNFYCYKTLSQA